MDRGGKPGWVFECVCGLIGGAAVGAAYLWSDGKALYVFVALVLVAAVLRWVCGFIVLLADLIGGRP